MINILAIDTSCDETAVAVTNGVMVLSNVIWSQASEHAKFGGVMPSLAKRMHEERIDWVIKKAIQDSGFMIHDINAVAVTAGPGLAIALEVGIKKAKELADKLKVPLIPVNHVEGHLLSALATPNTSPLAPLLNSGEGERKGVRWPALGLVVSGGHTELISIEKIGRYKISAKTSDDALGEALDKAARMLGLGYPGGAILEKMARLGNPKAYPLPLPMARSANKSSFSYSGIKTAMYRLVQGLGGDLSKEQIYNLAASFQNRAFQHLIKVIGTTLSDLPPNLGGRSLLVGGGVAANIQLRKRLRKLGKEMGFKVRFPYSTKLVGDNAAMIGVTASYKSIQDSKFMNYELVDRRPRWSVEEV